MCSQTKANCHPVNRERRGGTSSHSWHPASACGNNISLGRISPQALCEFYGRWTPSPAPDRGPSSTWQVSLGWALHKCSWGGLLCQLGGGVSPSRREHMKWAGVGWGGVRVLWEFPRMTADIVGVFVKDTALLKCHQSQRCTRSGLYQL